MRPRPNDVGLVQSSRNGVRFACPNRTAGPKLSRQSRTGVEADGETAVEEANVNLSVSTRLVSEPELKPGSRFQLTRLGIRRCPKLRGRTGTILGVARTGSGFRVRFDGTKFAQSLHHSYVMPIDCDKSG